MAIYPSSKEIQASFRDETRHINSLTVRNNHCDGSTKPREKTAAKKPRKYIVCGKIIHLTKENYGQ
ncbi:MAG TPA: hypothetical protein VK141_05155 [Nitrosomonas sp.]|nr:hypothetical protein [Nitrosomonas sp.]